MTLTVSSHKESLHDLPMLLVARRSLEQDVISDTSGDFKRTLVALLQAKRRHSFTREDVIADSEAIYQAGEKYVRLGPFNLHGSVTI